MSKNHMSPTAAVGDFILNQPLLASLYCFSLFFFYIVVQSLRSAWRSDLTIVPGPRIARYSALYRPWKISGGDAPDFYRQLHQKYGPIVRTGPNVVDISDPKAIMPIYAAGSKFMKSAFYSVFDVLYKDSSMPSMFSVRDPTHHQALRRPVAQKFSMSSIKAMEPFADDCSDIFISAMKSMEGTDVDLSEWLQWYAFDVISAITFHRRFGFMEQRKDVDSLIDHINQALQGASILSQIPGLHRWTLGSNFVRKFLAWQPLFEFPDPLRTVVKLTEDCIDEYDKKPPQQDRPDFLGWLRQENNKGEQMSRMDLVNHLSNNLLAGSDTTAISLRATIYYLVQNPECFARAQAEVDLADREGRLSEHITYAECLELPYLQAVMKESMRCCPGVSFPMERIVPQGGFELCGIHLQEGTIVGINPAVIHHDRSIFGEDAEKFNPERWLGDDEEYIRNMDRHIMTFGYGSRTCIGKNISIMEMGKLIPAILRNFDLEWASENPEWVIKTYWFARQEGLICRLKSRSR